VATPDLSILVQAVQKAGLAGALADRHGEYTVFAPTNEAFVALLGQLGLTSLDDVPVDTLRAILLDHVVPKELDAADVLRLASKGRPAHTLGGLDLRFTTSPLQVNGVDVVATDVEGSNGTVHVISSVLLAPPTPAT
jgi:transforming growth factor-beta-induced protein